MAHLLLIIAIFISAVIETDIYLPAFPDMMAYFSQNESSIQDILTYNFIGLCISGPIYGPVSDAIGRKKPLLFALMMFFFGSLVTVWANDFAWLLFGRVLQGVGGGGCFTLGTALIYDLFNEEEATAALNKINTIVPFIMASAPLAGGYLNQAFGFRSNFLVIAASVSICLFCCSFFLAETLPPTKRTVFSLKDTLVNFKKVLSSLQFLLLTLVISLLFAGYLVFLSNTAVIFVVELGVAKNIYPLYQFGLLLGYLIASLSASKIFKLWGAQTLRILGLSCLWVSAALLIICRFFFAQDPLLLTLAMLPYSFGFIWLQTPFVTKLMQLFPDCKGIAASALTSLRLLLTAIVVEVAAAFYDESISPTVVCICGIVLVVTGSNYAARPVARKMVKS